MRYFFFLLLLIANGVLALFIFTNDHAWFILTQENAALSKSPALHPEKIKLISAKEWESTPIAPTPVSTSNQPLNKPEENSKPVSISADASPQKFSSCIDIGSFNTEEAKKFEARLRNLLPLQFLTMQRKEALMGYMVFIPPQPSLQGVKKKLNELAALQVTDFYAIQETGPFKWGISLGIFKTEEAAKAHLAHLHQLGVRTAKITPRFTNPAKSSYRLHELQPKQLHLIEQLKTEFKTQTIIPC